MRDRAPEAVKSTVHRRTCGGRKHAAGEHIQLLATQRQYARAQREQHGRRAPSAILRLDVGPGDGNWLVTLLYHHQGICNKFSFLTLPY